MQTFPVKLSRTPVTVAILVLIPLLAAAIFIGPLLLFPNLADWVVMATIIVMMISAIWIVKYIIKNYASANAEVDMDENGIQVRLTGRSMFYRRKNYNSSWQGLENVSSNLDSQHNRRFYSIGFRRPQITLNVMPEDEVSDEEETPFGAALLEHVARYNSASEQSSETKIRQQGFYDTWWAHGITLFACLVMGAALVLHFLTPERVSSWRLLQAFCVSGMWLGTYYVNRRQRQ